MKPQKSVVTALLPASVLVTWTIVLLCGRYEISRDPGKWLDINANTGEIRVKRNFNIRSPHVRNNVYSAAVKATGGLLSHSGQTGWHGPGRVHPNVVAYCRAQMLPVSPPPPPS